MKYVVLRVIYTRDVILYLVIKALRVWGTSSVKCTKEAASRFALVPFVQPYIRKANF